MPEVRRIIDFEVYSRTKGSNLEIQAGLQQSEKFEILAAKTVPVKRIRNLPNG